MWSTKNKRGEDRNPRNFYYSYIVFLMSTISGIEYSEKHGTKGKGEKFIKLPLRHVKRSAPWRRAEKANIHIWASEQSNIRSSADIHQSHIVIYVIVCYHFPFTSAHSILAATKRLINQIGSSLHLIHTSVVHRPVFLQNQRVKFRLYIYFGGSEILLVSKQQFLWQSKIFFGSNTCCPSW